MSLLVRINPVLGLVTASAAGMPFYPITPNSARSAFAQRRNQLPSA